MKHLVTLVEQKLFTLPERLSIQPVFAGVRIITCYYLCVVLYISLFVILSLYWSLYCLSVSDYPFVIFQLFFTINYDYIVDLVYFPPKVKETYSRFICTLIPN